MSKKIILGLIVLICSSVLIISAGCANRDAAQLGVLIGRTLGRPIGTAATVIDETFHTVGDVVAENPRHRKTYTEPSVRIPESAAGKNDDKSFYYRTEVLVKTRGPARIESLQLQQAEDVSEFWRE